MPSNFNSYIENIDTGYLRDLCMNQGELRHYEKGEEFITVGAIGLYVGYVKSGALKYECYSSDGTPHVTGLVYTGLFVGDFYGSLYRQKSRCSIIATMPCEIYCMPSAWVAGQMQADARFKVFVNDTIRELYSTLYNRYIDLYSKSPLQRYKELLSREPNIFAFFSLKDIASLLNITPTHLSRLRKS